VIDGWKYEEYKGRIRCRDCRDLTCKECSSVILKGFVRVGTDNYHPCCIRCSDCHCTLENSDILHRDQKPYCVPCFEALMVPKRSIGQSSSAVAVPTEPEAAKSADIRRSVFPAPKKRKLAPEDEARARAQFKNTLRGKKGKQNQDAKANGRIDFEDLVIVLTGLMAGRMQSGNIRRLAKISFSSVDAEETGYLTEEQFLDVYDWLEAEAAPLKLAQRSSLPPNVIAPTRA